MAIDLNKLGEDSPLSRISASVERFSESFSAIPIEAIATPLLHSVASRRENLASDFFERLREWIEEYEAALDEESEVGVRLVSFGQSVTFHLTEMSYWNPELIRFDGIDDEDRPVQLIQHVSQISVFLTTLPKREEEPVRIGFHRGE